MKWPRPAMARAPIPARTPIVNREAVLGVARSILRFGWGTPIVDRLPRRRKTRAHWRDGYFGSAIQAFAGSLELNAWTGTCTPEPILSVRCS